MFDAAELPVLDHAMTESADGDQERPLALSI
jgi:hypothetical protein